MDVKHAFLYEGRRVFDNTVLRDSLDLKPLADMAKNSVKEGEHVLAFANFRAHVWTR
jgi:hypothetical protein